MQGIDPKKNLQSCVSPKLNRNLHEGSYGSDSPTTEHIPKLNKILPEGSFGCDLLDKVALVVVDSDLILTRDADDDVAVAQDRQTDRPVEIRHLNKLKLKVLTFQVCTFLVLNFENLSNGYF
jgi:hypothetical protein